MADTSDSTETENSAEDSAAKKTSANKTSAKKTTANKTTAKKSPAKKGVAKKSPARKSPARKSSATKSAPRKRSAKKGGARQDSGSDEASNQPMDTSASPEETSRSRRAAAKTESGQEHRSSSDGMRRTSPMRVAAVALEQLAALTGRPSEGVVGIENQDGEWVVEIEVLELSRIPNTTDVLARYRVTADDSGEVTGYHRVQRYVRGTPGEE